jgi:hypothetical protein
MSRTVAPLLLTQALGRDSVNFMFWRCYTHTHKHTPAYSTVWSLCARCYVDATAGLNVVARKSLLLLDIQPWTITILTELSRFRAGIHIWKYQNSVNVAKISGKNQKIRKLKSVRWTWQNKFRDNLWSNWYVTYVNTNCFVTKKFPVSRLENS